MQCIAALGASRSLFSRLLTRVVHATMHWHDITPSGKSLSHLGSASQTLILSGRLLNRFSKDMDAIDNTLSNTMMTVSTSLAAFGVAVLTVAYVLFAILYIYQLNRLGFRVFFPTFLVPATFIALLYRMIAKRYLNISRQLRRMESTSRSPVFSGFGELLEGIVTIRAFSAENRFMEEFHKKNDIAIKV